MALKITEMVERIPVFDITVVGNENFFANGILVHNCVEILLLTNPIGSTETYDIHVPTDDVIEVVNELGSSDLVNNFKITL